MAMHRTKATIIGLLEIGRVNEWVVTEKLGDALKPKASATSTPPHVSSAPVKKPKAFASIWGRYIFSRLQDLKLPYLQLPNYA